MGVSTDAYIAKALDDDLFQIGTQDPSGVLGHNTIDISAITAQLGISYQTADLEIVSQGYLSVERSTTRDWVDIFLVKVPQEIITSRGCGLSAKSNMLTLHVKTPKEKGLYYNSAVSTFLEEHYFYNKKVEVPLGGTVSVTKTYQQPSILLGNDGRFFNRVFVETDYFYHNERN